MIYHPTVDTIRELLIEHGAHHAVFEHEPVRTSEEAAAIRPQYSIAQGAKALIVRVKKNGEKSFAMIVVPGDAKFDVKKAKAALDASDIRFATEDEVGEVTNGVQPGGVPPFGNIFNLPVYADQRVFANEEMIFNAGDRSVSIAMETDVYRNIVKPTVVDIVASD